MISKIKNRYKLISLYFQDMKMRMRHLYMQDIIYKKIKAKGGEIERPFMHFNCDKLMFTPPIYIGPHSQLYLRANLRIGKGSIIGPHFIVHSANHRYEGDMLPYDDVYEAKSITIGQNVWIGSNVMILPGITIGDGAVIGAGTIVTRDVPRCAIVCGNPCRIVKYRDINRYERLVKSQKNYLELKSLGLTEIDELKRIKIIY